MRPVEGQIDDLISEVNKEDPEKKNKVLVDNADKTDGRRFDRLYAGTGNPCQISSFRY